MLTTWEERPAVVQNLFSPPFCALLLWAAVAGFGNVGLEYPLLFLVLPMILHRRVRHALPRQTRTTLTAWLQDQPELAVLLPNLTREMTPFTAAGLLWGFNSNCLNVSVADGKVTSQRMPPSPNDVTDDAILEVSDC